MNSHLSFSSDFSRIDMHALNAPVSAGASVASLASYLVRPTRTETERARAIFSWIAANIGYDTDKYFGKSAITGETADSALRTKKGVCAGYSNLFESLARAAGLEVVTIAGHGKGYGFKTGDTKADVNHDWNAVRIDGDWQLIDSTWGAGFIDERKKFVRKFDDFYFCTPPHYFIFSHFPEKTEWQLLKRTISSETYLNTLRVKPLFFRFGIKPLTHSRAVIGASGTVKIGLGAKADISVIAEIVSPTLKTILPLVLVQNQEKDFHVYASFPKPGEYILRIYAKPKSAKGDYDELMEYCIEARDVSRTSAYYPGAYSAFSEHHASVVEPLRGYLAGGTTERFTLVVPDALEVAVVCGKEWNRFKPSNGNFSGGVKIKPGDVTVYARFKSDNQFEGLLRYIAR